MNKLQYTAISADEDGNTNHKVTITAEFNESIGENAAVELVGKALAMFFNEVRRKNNERAD